MDGYENLGHHLRAARGCRSRREIAEATGIAENTIIRYESGQAFRGIPQKMRRLAAFYRWTPDSVAEVLRGGEPKVVPAVPPIPPITSEHLRELIVMVGESNIPPEGRAALLRVLTEGGVIEAVPPQAKGPYGGAGDRPELPFINPEEDLDVVLSVPTRPLYAQ